MAGTKKAIPMATRRAVAARFGGETGKVTPAACAYCGAPGRICWAHWTKAWVSFPGLELDHVIPEAKGGDASPENVTLACRSCNRRKRDKAWTPGEAR